MKSLLISLLFCLTLIGCSNQPARTSEEKVAAALEQLEMQPDSKIERIRDYKVRSWRYIDQYNLIIEAGLRDQYLVSLQTPCFELQSAFAIGFTSTVGSLDRFEDIVVRDTFGSAKRCPISDIVKLRPRTSNNAEPPPE